MKERTYWLDLFTGITWKEFLDSGATVSGFREMRWKAVQQIKQGDYLLCYMTGLSRWIAVLEVMGEPFKDNKPIWKGDLFPCRVSVKVVAQLTPETAIPITQLREQLSIFQNLTSPFAWTGHLRGSPVRWNANDGDVIVQAIIDAQQNPIVREVDQQKLNRIPRTLQAKIGLVTVPENEDNSRASSGQSNSLNGANAEEDVGREPSLHTEMQWKLLKLGSEMGLDVWVARNDQSREFNGNAFSKIPRLIHSLPVQFDEATKKTIELIDVLWLKSKAIVAAFEIECTTSIYSGILRMSDLISMQPNINIPLYIVAPEMRREKVMTEINRPTFSRLSPPLRESCRYIAIPVLNKEIDKIRDYVKHLRPEFLEDLSESCEFEEV